MQKKTNGAKLKLIKAQAVAQMLRQCSSVNEILEEIRCSFKKEREEKEMKKGLQRLFGGLMAIVMVLSLVMISPGAEKNLVKAEGEETPVTIQNGDFEADSFWNDWDWRCTSGVYDASTNSVEQYAYADNEWLTPPSETSTKSAKFWTKTADTLNITAKTSVSLSAGTYTYHVSAMGEKATVKFSLGSDIVSEEAALEGWNVWTDATGTITVSEDMEAWIGIEIVTEDDGYGYIDSVSLSKQESHEEEEVEVPVILNGDFETNSENESGKYGF